MTKPNDTVHLAVTQSPDPYSTTVSIVITALRAGILKNGMMNAHEALLLQKMMDTLVELDPNTGGM